MLTIDDAYCRAIFTTGDSRSAADRAYAALSRRGFIVGMSQVILELGEADEVTELRGSVELATKREAEDLELLHGGK